jgi:hypothetical protein
MKKTFTLISLALLTMGAYAQTDSYTACTADGLAAEFAAVVDETGAATNVANGQSLVSYSSANVSFEAVGGTTPANAEGGGQDITPEGVVNTWNKITWSAKNQGDISFYYVAGTGNPYTALAAEEIVTDGVGTGTYRALYTFYAADGSHGLPVTGLYYKFKPTVSGTMKVAVWSNKGNRNTYVVDEATKLPIAYTAEGYINGQNGEDGKKKYLTSEEIKVIHDAAKIDAETGEDKAPYVIGAGNQPFWGYVTFAVEAGGTYLLFQDSSQIGFGGFAFTAGTSGVMGITASAADSNAPVYNLSGQKVSSSYKGMVIQNGKKFIK